MPTLRVDNDVFEYLVLQKHGRDSMSDVVRRRIAMVEGPPGDNMKLARPRRAKHGPGAGPKGGP